MRKDEVGVADSCVDAATQLFLNFVGRGQHQTSPQFRHMCAKMECPLLFALIIIHTV